MKEILLTLVTAVAAYLLGCISTGTIVSRREGVNIRNEGSHNTCLLYTSPSPRDTT